MISAEYREGARARQWKIPICKMSGEPNETDLDHDGNVVCDECAGELEWVEVVPADDKRVLEARLERMIRMAEAHGNQWMREEAEQARRTLDSVKQGRS